MSSCFAKRPPNIQFTNIAPLPGSGNALDEEGKPDGQGALQLNIPIAYTPGEGYINISAFTGEYIRSWSKDKWENGSGVIGMGFGKSFPRVYLSGMFVSRWLIQDSKVISGQLQVLPESDKTPAFAIGVQDLQNKEWGEFRNQFNTKVSYYAVATKAFPAKDRKIYASFGYGKGRFLDSFFGGVSVPINDYFSVAAEYDGYQINEVAIWRPSGRYSNLSVSLGNNSKCGPVAGICVTNKIPTYWAIPMFLFLWRSK
jgi:hypothetical protein